MNHIAIIGRLPALSIAELEAVFGAESIQPFTKDVVLTNCQPTSKYIDRLGGTIKLAEITHELSPAWPAIEKYLTQNVTSLLNKPDGKLVLGISAYGARTNHHDISKLALQLKKSLRKAGQSVRIVPNNQQMLSSAQSLHNKLDTNDNCELIIVRSKHKAIIAKLTEVQNITRYAKRDQARPKRDARVGMLPPKLAQTIINLSLQPAKQSKLQTPPVLLDPFCGTGVILQEAMLMGCTILGTDLEPRMIDYSKTNIDWLIDTHSVTGSVGSIEVGNATTHQWPEANTIAAVACETYLGDPLAHIPSPEKLRQIISGIDILHKKFLKNIAQQIQPGTILCLAIPAWRINGSLKQLTILDKLKDFGYTRIEYKHIKQDDLIYYREDQIVARQLIVLRKD